MVLTVSETGYGKRTQVSDFPTKGRGGQGRDRHVYQSSATA